MTDCCEAKYVQWTYLRKEPRQTCLGKQDAYYWNELDNPTKRSRP